MIYICFIYLKGKVTVGMREGGVGEEGEERETERASEYER